MKYLKYTIIVILIINVLTLFINQKKTILSEVANESNLIELKNPSIITNSNVSKFKALLINNKEKTIYINYIEIIIKDSENNIICTFSVEINKSIEVDQSIKIEKEVNYDLSDATSFDYIVN